MTLYAPFVCLFSRIWQAKKVMSEVQNTNLISFYVRHGQRNHDSDLAHI